MTKLKHIFLSILFIGITTLNWSQSNCFPKVKQHEFVYDEANILNQSQENTLNTKLKEFTKNTSNVLVILTTPDLCGYDKAEYTYTFADEVGVGREDLDNGVVLMVKPKEIDGVGETFIAVGNGLQGAIPDLVASKDIVRKELIPHFKLQDYYGGIESASDVIIALASGEISHEDYAPQKEGSWWMIVAFFAVFFLLFYFAQKHGGGKNDDWETFDRSGKRVGRRGSSSNWIWIGGGGFGGGGGSSSGGGFGGFGGGGFDGGGAGGSW